VRRPDGRLLNHLQWTDDPDPYEWQPVPTVLETAAAAGVRVTVVSRSFYRGTGLSVAANRGGWYHVADDGPAVADGHGMGPVGTDPDAAPDAEQISLFPPLVDVGPLPEPVDGFPWIDPGSLGLYHSGPVGAGTDEPVPAGDLAAYAAQDLPPGVDPWAELAGSDDPATSALARWWQPES
jgi:hypothetical protein